MQESIRRGQRPPDGLSAPLQGLWQDALGDWDRAHVCAQKDPGSDGSWVHAYLHRKEGDRGNAGYWYRRAGRPMPAASQPLQAEWEEIARALLAERG